MKTQDMHKPIDEIVNKYKNREATQREYVLMLAGLKLFFNGIVANSDIDGTEKDRLKEFMNEIDELIKKENVELDKLLRA